jgi:hypothetical protein
MSAGRSLLTWLRLSVIDYGRRVPDSVPQTYPFAEDQSTGFPFKKGHLVKFRLQLDFML